VTVTVRQARPEELTTAGEVVLQAYLADGFLTADDPYSDHLRDAPGRARDSVVLVAVEDDEIVGSVTWCPVGSSHREIGREGEGEQLVRACLDRARQAGYHAVVLSSGDWMHAAHRVYERLGFVRIPERDWTPVPGVNLLAYRVALA
jgi:predicted N-acetyltransferase YhbS